MKNVVGSGDHLVNRAIVLLIFFGVFATYAYLTPGSIAGMGYTGEEMQSGDSMLAVVQARLSGHPAPAVKWSRNGPLPVVLNLPFQIAGKRIASEDFVLSFDPMLETALLVTILFVWLLKLTSPGLAFLLTMAAAFGTMLWPYAYIGLETKQSLFVLLAGYLALECGPIRSFWRALLFGLCCAFAIGAKANSVVLFPAVAYLIYVQFSENWRPRLPLALTTVGVGAVLLPLASVAKSHYWAALGVTAFTQLQAYLNDSAFKYLGSVIGMFGSPTKGLLLYAPIVLLSLYAVPRAWRAHRRVTVFALLAVGGIVAGFGFMRYFADEVWGPRYLHTCVAPLLLLIGASRREFSLGRDALMVPLLAFGVVISFLGAFYYYGNLYGATVQAGENSEEELLGDTKWNQVWFNGQLFTIWWKHPAGPVLWLPAQHWMWEAPRGTLAPNAVDLRAWSQPQALVIRSWGRPHSGLMGVVWVLLWICAFAGPLLLISAGVRLLGAGPPERHIP